MKRPIVHNKYLKLYEETAKNKIAKVLFRYPEKEFSLSDLAREAGVAKANIGNSLQEFLEANLITIEKLSKIWRIRADLRDEYFMRNKMLYNLHVLLQSSVIEIIDGLYNHPKAIILFGSFRRGEDITQSDIDIAIEVEKEVKYSPLSLRQLLKEDSGEEKAIIEFEEKIGRHIQVFPFNRKDVDLNVFNNIANGIVLWGFLEVKK